MKLLSVIIPMYNVEKYIERCLNSIILALYNINYEIILVDNNSTDNTVCVCNKYLNERIKIFNEKKQGVSATRNRGVLEAKGDYIAFVDADDEVSCDYFSTMLNLLENQQADYVSVGHCEIYSNEKKEYKFNSKKTYILKEKECLQHFLDYHNIGWNVWGKLFNSSIVKQVKFLEDIKIGEDMFFLYEITKLAKKIIIHEEALYFYTMRNDSAMNTYDLSQYFDVVFLIEKIYKENIKNIDKDYFYVYYNLWFLEFVSIRDKEKKYLRERKKILVNIKKIITIKIFRKLTKKGKIQVVFLLVSLRLYNLFIKIYSKIYLKKRQK